MTLTQQTKDYANNLVNAANRQDWQQVHDIAKAIVGNSLTLLEEEMYKENDNSEMFDK